MSAGRPSKYKKKYCKEIVEFFRRSPFTEREIPVYNKEGGILRTDYKKEPNSIPFFFEFADKIGVSDRSLERWEKRYEEFSRAYKKAKELQKAFLITNGLLGLYNPTFAIFTAKNITDMRDEKNLNIEGEIAHSYGVIVLPEMLDLKEGDDVLALMEGKSGNLSGPTRQ